MFKLAELTITLTAIPDAEDLAAFIARAVELGLVVSGAGADTQIEGRYAVTVTTGPEKDAGQVQQAFNQLMTAADNIKG